MITLPIIEIHLTHSCNYQCDNCSHFSNYKHSGMLSLEDAELWYSQWNKRIFPESFIILGGEPTLHPDLCEHILLARQYWKDSRIILKTNGSFLHNHPTLPKVFNEIGNCYIDVSIHSNDKKKYEDINTLLKGWRRKHHIVFVFNDSVTIWNNLYIGQGSSMLPFEDNDPEASYKQCRAKMYKQLYDGKIWKCAMTAYLPMQHKKFGLSDKWQDILDYIPISSDCTDDELNTFSGLKHENCCKLCSAKPRYLPK